MSMNVKTKEIEKGNKLYIIKSRNGSFNSTFYSTLAKAKKALSKDCELVEFESTGFSTSIDAMKRENQLSSIINGGESFPNTKEKKVLDLIRSYIPKNNTGSYHNSNHYYPYYNMAYSLETRLEKIMSTDELKTFLRVYTTKELLLNFCCKTPKDIESVLDLVVYNKFRSTNAPDKTYKWRYKNFDEVFQKNGEKNFIKAKLNIKSRKKAKLKK